MMIDRAPRVNIFQYGPDLRVGRQDSGRPGNHSDRQNDVGPWVTTDRIRPVAAQLW